MNATIPTRAWRSGLAASLAALACWASGPLYIKHLTHHFDVWTQNLYRYLIATLCLLPWLLWARAHGRVPADLWRRALVPAAANVGMQCLWAAAFYYLNPAFMMLLSQGAVLWVTAFSFFVFPDERALFRRGRFWLGLALALAGLAGVLVAGRGFRAEGSAFGIALTLTSSVVWAVYVVSARHAFRRTASELGFAVISLYTLIGLLAVALVATHPFRGLPTTWKPWSSVVISGVIPIAVAHPFYYAAMKRLGATGPAVLNLLLPFLVLPLSVLVFGEPFIGTQWLWGLVLVAGCALALFAHRAPDARRG